jgi:hypothetical protein
MCASCGCKQLDDDHGDSRHLTMQDLEAAAEAAEISVDEVVQNLEDAVEMAPAAAGSRKDGAQ